MRICIEIRSKNLGIVSFKQETRLLDRLMDDFRRVVIGKITLIYDLQNR